MTFVALILMSVTADKEAQRQAKRAKVPYNNKRNKGEQMTPNWQKNSGKAKKGKGMCKGIIKARKQALKALKAKLNKG